MKLKLIMENWRSTIQESDWTPIDILEAVVEDYGLDVHSAPNWMKYAVSFFAPDIHHDVVVFAALEEDDPRILDDWRMWNKLWQEDVPRNRVLEYVKKFLDKTAKDLSIPRPQRPIDFFPITQLGIDSMSTRNSWKRYYDRDINALIIPAKAVPLIAELYNEFLDELEGDLEAFLYNYGLSKAHDVAEEIKQNEDPNSWESPLYDTEAQLRETYAEIIQASRSY